MAVYGISDVLLFGEGAFKRSGREQSRSLFKAKFTLESAIQNTIIYTVTIYITYNLYDIKCYLDLKLVTIRHIRKLFQLEYSIHPQHGSNIELTSYDSDKFDFGIFLLIL